MSVFNKHVTDAYPIIAKGKLFVPQIMGGTPTDSKVAQAWLKTKVVADDDQIRAMVAETMLERGVGLDEAVDIVDDKRHLVGFKKDEVGPYVEGRQLKAAMKEALSIAVAAGKIDQRGWGTTKKFVTSYFPEHVFVQEKRLHMFSDEACKVPFAEKHIAIEQKFVHSRFGAAISYSEYLIDAFIPFTIVTDHNFTEKQWAMMWLTGERNGLGASRSQGYGTYEVVEWDVQIDQKWLKAQAAAKAKPAKDGTDE